MELLIGIAVLALIAGMVCVWLTGNLFGRVLTFLVLAVVRPWWRTLPSWAALPIRTRLA